MLRKIPWLSCFLVKIRLLPKSYYHSWSSNPRLYDCRKRLPFADCSVDFIYTSHFIEHLPRYQASSLLIECRRILRSSGVLRISVPDVKLLADKYINGDQEFFLKLEDPDAVSERLKNLTDLFVQNFYGYDSWSIPTWKQRLQRSFTRGHLWMYDYRSLSDLLSAAGFSIVQRCKPGQRKVPDIKYLDIHKIGSMLVEASTIINA